MWHWRKTREIRWTESPVDNNRSNQHKDLWTFRYCPHQLSAGEPACMFIHNFLMVSLVSHHFNSWTGFKTSKTSFIEDKILVQKTGTVFIFCFSDYGDTGHRENFPWFCMDFLCLLLNFLLKPSFILTISHQLFPLLILSSSYTGLPMAIAKPHRPCYCFCCGAMTAAEWLGGQQTVGNWQPFQLLKAKCHKDHKSEARSLR